MEKKSCQKLFKCSKCSKEFTKKPDLTNHITLIHGNVTPVVNSVVQEKTNKAIPGMFITSANTPKRPCQYLIRVLVNLVLKLNYCSLSALNFLSWEFLLVKKLEIEKTKTTFIISVFKVVF